MNSMKSFLVYKEWCKYRKEKSELQKCRGILLSLQCRLRQLQLERANMPLRPIRVAVVTASHMSEPSTLGDSEIPRRGEIASHSKTSSFLSHPGRGEITLHTKILSFLSHLGRKKAGDGNGFDSGAVGARHFSGVFSHRSSRSS